MMSALLFSFFLQPSAMANEAEAPKAPVKSVVRAVFVDLPAGCYAKKLEPCALKITEKGEISWKGGVLHVSKDTSLRLNRGLEILEGEVWAENLKDAKIRHGQMEAEVSGEVLIERNADLVRFYSLDGDVEVSGPGLAHQNIPAGFQNWYRGLGARGVWQQGILEPLQVENFLTLWRKVLTVSAVDLKEKIAVYREHRAHAVEESSRLYRQYVQQRAIASEKVERAQAVERQKIQRERDDFKKMARDRLYQM